MTAGRPLKFKTLKILQDKVDDYFASCLNDDGEFIRPYSITGLALHLDTSRETLLEYQEREEFVDAINKAKLRCHNWVEEAALMNKVNAVTAIFNLKNNYGWKDKSETDVTSGGEKIAPVTIVNFKDADTDSTVSQ